MNLLGGWKLTCYTAALIGMYLVMWIALHGLDEESIRSMIRGTARSSFSLFLITFSASSIQSLFRSPWSTWIVRNRRYLGVSFAVSHFYHLGLLASLSVLFSDPFFDDLNAAILAINALAYGFISAMALTSSDRAQQILGARWRQLHFAGAYFIFFVFVASYIPRALNDNFYIPFVIAIGLVTILKVRYLIAKTRFGGRIWKSTST